MSEEQATEEQGEASPKKGSARPENKLTKDSDVAVRPGFRNPANTRSKAMKKKKRKKGKKK